MNFLIMNWRDIKHPEAGGLEIRLHELAKRMVKDGHSVTFLCSRFKNSKKSEKIDGINIMRVGWKHSKYSFGMAAFFHYLFRLRHNNYDLVTEDLDKTPLFFPIYVKKPLLACYSQLNKEIYFKELSFPFSAIAFFLEQKLMPFIYRKTSFVVASESTKKELTSLGLKQNKIFVVNDGLNSSAYKPIPFSRKKHNQLLVLGRLKKYKGVQYIIRAMPDVIKALPKAKLYIAGTGNYADKLKRLVKKLRLEKNVLFQGYVSEKEKIRLLQESVLLINYSFKEGWGINVIEANACGTPVIASDVPGLRDSVINSKTGFLVKHGDEKALSNAIINLLHNTGLRKRLGRNAVEHAKGYDWDSSYKEFITVIQELLLSAKHQ